MNNGRNLQQDICVPKQDEGKNNLDILLQE